MPACVMLSSIRQFLRELILAGLRLSELIYVKLTFVTLIFAALIFVKQALPGQCLMESNPIVRPYGRRSHDYYDQRSRSSQSRISETLSLSGKPRRIFKA